jgi:RimJ/RimL family protein N-acetyltransferase
MIDPKRRLARQTLGDGTEISIRPIRPDDRTRILDAFKNLDQESVYRRFFSPRKELTDAELRELTDVDLNQVVALVATAQSEGCEILLGGARYACNAEQDSQSAELAFLTQGPYRGRGIAGLLLRHLSRLARDAGLSRFEADVLAQNEPMLNVFRRSGLPMTQHREDNVIHVTLTL